MERVYVESITNEEVSQLPIGAFSGKIVVIDRPEDVATACEQLRQNPLIGFDTETRPSFTKGHTNKVSLLQLSGPDTAYLFRLNRVGFPETLRSLLSSRDHAKIGVGVYDDIRGLRSLHRFQPQNFIELQNVAPRYGITEKSLRKLAAIILHFRISKAQRLSNWEAQQLTPAQQLYAATDAWVGREIYIELSKVSPLIPVENRLTSDL